MKDTLTIFEKPVKGTWKPVERLQDSMTRTRYKAQTTVKETREFMGVKQEIERDMTPEEIREYLATFGAVPHTTTETDLPAWIEFHTFTTNAERVYKIERQFPNHPRDDHPVLIRGVWTIEESGEFVPCRLVEKQTAKASVLFDLDKGRGLNEFHLVNRKNPEQRTILKRARGPFTGGGKNPFVEIEFPDGTLETAILREETVMDFQPAPSMTGEDLLRIEDAILRECENPAFSDLKNPTMREFYLEYVQGPDSLENTAKRNGWKKRTLNNRVRDLETRISISNGIETPLHVLKRDPTLRKARRLQAEGLKQRRTR